MPRTPSLPRYRQLALVLTTLLTPVLFSACDGGEASPDCPLGLAARGTFTATLDGAAYRANCFSVTVNSQGQLFVTGFEADGTTSESLTLVMGGVESRVYQLEVRDDRAYVDHGLATTTRTYDEGTITLELYTDSQVRGTFDVATEGGVSEAAGRFDVRY